MTKETPRVLKEGFMDSHHSLNFLQMSKWCEINTLSSRKWLNMIWAVEFQKFLTSLYKSF